MKSQLFKSFLYIAFFAFALTVPADDRFPEVISLPDGWGRKASRLGAAPIFMRGRDRALLIRELYIRAI
jgi:hypothetical protein